MHWVSMGGHAFVGIVGAVGIVPEAPLRPSAHKLLADVRQNVRQLTSEVSGS